MRKSIRLSLVSILVATMISPAASSWAGSPAPVKVGKNCITPKQVVKLKGVQYICQNVNSQLNKWALFKNTNTSSQMKSQGTAQEIPCDVKSKNFGSNFPTSFNDLYDNRTQISCDAWSRLNASLTQTTGKASTLPPVDIEIGPNTHPQDPTMQELNSLNNLFSAQGTFKKITVIYFDPTDLPWATDLARKLMGSNEVQKQFLSEPNADPRGVPLIHCIPNGPLNCDSGNAWVTSDGQAFLGLGVPDTSYNSVGNGMAIAAAEYFHALILNPYILNNSLQNATSGSDGQDALSAINNLPQWLGVSGESFMHLLETDGNSYQSYLNEISRDLSNQVEDIKSNIHGIADTYGTTFDLAWINRLFDISNASGKWRSNFEMNQVGFKIGTRVSEILVALKGPAIFVQIDSLMAQGKIFDDAFQSVFGVTWETAEPIIAKTVWDEYQHNY